MRREPQVIRRRRAAAVAVLLLAVGGLLIFVLLPRAGTDAATARGGVILSVPGGRNLSLTEAEARRIVAGSRPLPVPSRRVAVPVGASRARREAGVRQRKRERRRATGLRDDPGAGGQAGVPEQL
ncbi:MAG: hypothetical protein J0H06_03065 [Actinobacteria bacterium]|nr:hypothetical protein [Actinomycetota bacterium]